MRAVFHCANARRRRCFRNGGAIAFPGEASTQNLPLKVTKNCRGAPAISVWLSPFGSVTT